jgi:hypothetical protein
MGDDVMMEEWIENGNGNWVWVDSDGARATVYATNNGWGGVWNGAADGRPRRLKAKFEDAEEAIDAVESAAMEGDASPKWYPPYDEWIESKKGGCHRKVNGAVVAVKQAKSGSWYAVAMGGALLGENGGATWFPTAEEACKAVNALADGSQSWCWITRQ